MSFSLMSRNKEFDNTHNNLQYESDLDHILVTGITSPSRILARAILMETHSRSELVDGIIFMVLKGGGSSKRF